MVGEEPIDIGDVPPPTWLIYPHALSSSRVAAPPMNTSNIPKLQVFILLSIFSLKKKTNKLFMK